MPRDGRVLCLVLHGPALAPCSLLQEGCMIRHSSPEFASMDESTEKLTSAALRLPPADRAKLAEALLVSLEGEDPSWEAAWLVEAARRSRAANADPSRVRTA